MGLSSRTWVSVPEVAVLGLMAGLSADVADAVAGPESDEVTGLQPLPDDASDVQEASGSGGEGADFDSEDGLSEYNPDKDENVPAGSVGKRKRRSCSNPAEQHGSRRRFDASCSVCEGGGGGGGGDDDEDQVPPKQRTSATQKPTTPSQLSARRRTTMTDVAIPVAASDAASLPQPAQARHIGLTKVDDGRATFVERNADTALSTSGDVGRQLGIVANEEEDEEDLLDQLKEIEIRRKLRALKRRKRESHRTET